MADLESLTPEIDPERLRRMMALTQPGVPKPAVPTAPDIQRLSPVGGDSIPASDATGLKPIGFKQRQALPLTSPGVQAGSSAYYQNKLERIDDQKANPLGSAENHPGVLGKIGHVLGTIGNKALDVTGINTIPGTEANREARQAYDQQEIGQAKTRESADAARKSEQELGGRRQDLAERKEDFEEGKPEKPGTPDEQAIAAKVQETNPATGKPYTAYEARLALAQGIEDTKSQKDAPPHTVTMLDKEGGKPFTYQYMPGQVFTGDGGYGPWKKVGPAQPNAAAMGLIGTLTPLINPQTGEIMGTMNTKTGAINPIAPNSLTGGSSETPGATTSSAARIETTRANQFNTQYVKPATDIEQNFQKFQGALRDYQANPKTGAASMVALAQHLGSTFGSIKGTTQGEHMIGEHKDAIGWLDRIGRYADQAATGQQLSADQWKEFNELITNTRQIQWQTTAKEAARRHQPIDFLPADVHINMADSSGKARPVPGNKVQEYLDKGAVLAN